MTNTQYHCLKELRPGSYNWNIKVRIIRVWRGASRTGGEFKGLNMLLLDDKNTRMHAFVPGTVIEKHQQNLELDSVCTMYNFSVKDYKPEEKFRVINSDRQIIFTTYTDVVRIKDDDLLIQKNMFDFYDLQDLSKIENHNGHLIDVIGVIQKDTPIRDLKNKYGETQLQVKFTIVDGSCLMNVTFWDSFAKEFSMAFDEVEERPAIIIIASAKINSWVGTNQTTPQIDISNTSATKFYLNYIHYSVAHMRRQLSSPMFSQYDFSSQIVEKLDLLTVKEIKLLGKDYANKEVICNVKITLVDESTTCYAYECTSCYRDIECVDGIFECSPCHREVPMPTKKFEITTEAEDDTGNIDIILFDRCVRTITGLTVSDVEDEDKIDDTFPMVLKSIENKWFTVKLLIRKENVEEKHILYHAADIYRNPDESPSSIMEITNEELHQSVGEISETSIHLDGFSQLTFETPKVEKKKRLRKANKKYQGEI